MSDATAVDTLIVGAGIAGIGLGHQLRRAGLHNFVILERSNRPGGTWRENRYPGAACDVPSHLYSYSFAPNPDWSRLFAPQPEILAYVERCAHAFGLMPHLRLRSAVQRARWDADAARWRVETSTGERYDARHLVSCAGHALSRPVYPDAEGRERFAGVQMHSSAWNDQVDLRGKRVAVVGTGASAIQIVPSIAERVGQLYVLQRTAGWLIPRPDVAMPPAVRRLFAVAPWTQKLVRGAIYSYMEAYAAGYVFEPRLLAIRERSALAYLREEIPDPELRRALTPTHRAGCKRILISSDYYAALRRPNVTLVPEGLRALDEQAVVTAGGRRLEVDVVIHATGFETAEASPPFELVGRDGLTLADAWREGISAYLGTAIPGFPNLFLLLGPNSGLGHSSMIYMMESQFAYIVDALSRAHREGWRWFDVRPDVTRRYNDWIQARLARSVWNTGGCESWYLTRTGRNTTVWPGFTFEFRHRLRRFDPASYELG